MIVYLLILILFYAIFKNCVEGIGGKEKGISLKVKVGRLWLGPKKVILSKQKKNIDDTITIPCDKKGVISLTEKTNKNDKDLKDPIIDNLSCKTEEKTLIDRQFDNSNHILQTDTNRENNENENDNDNDYSGLLFSNYNPFSTENREIILSEMENNKFIDIIEQEFHDSFLRFKSSFT